MRGQYDLRDHIFIPDVARYSSGSCVTKLGHTEVLCSVSIQKKHHIQEPSCLTSFLTLPSALPLGQRACPLQEHAMDKALHHLVMGVIDPIVFQTHTVYMDCHVLQHDGSIYAAMVSGGALALSLAFKKAQLFKDIAPIKHSVVGIVCGVIKGEIVLDLDRAEEAQAEAVGFCAVTTEGALLLASLESKSAIPVSLWQQMTDLCVYAGQKIYKKQREALKAA